MTIRDFNPDDYESIVRIGNAMFSEHPRTADEMRWGDDHRDPKCKWGRFIGETADGQTVAVGDFGQGSGTYHPRKFHVFILVDPAYQGKGCGKAMYERLLDALEPFDPVSVRSNARENMTRSVRFLEDRGFVEDMRYWESHLDVNAFDVAPYGDVEEKVTAHGITIKTMQELGTHNPETRRKIYELVNKIQEDVPSPEAHTPMDYEVWLRGFDHPGILPDANFIALDGDRYVGISNLWKNQGDDHLHTGLTGVLREYRRKGIALALKIRALRYAKEAGAPVIRTGNETNNRAMLSINERLGFVKQPAWIDYVKKIKDEKGEEAAS